MAGVHGTHAIHYQHQHLTAGRPGVRLPATQSRVPDLDYHVAWVLDLRNWTVLNGHFEWAFEDDRFHCVVSHDVLSRE